MENLIVSSLTFFVLFFCFVMVSAFVISVHELGHALAMSAFRRRIEEISIGIGKPLVTYTDSTGCKLSLKWCLIGGYVEEHLSTNRPNKHGQDILIAGAGPLANILCAFGMFFIAHQWLGLENQFTVTVIVKSIADIAVGLLHYLFIMPFTTEYWSSLWHGQEVVHQNSESPNILRGLDLFQIVWVLTTYVNIITAMLNMLPFLPLDGGRILQSWLLWAIPQRRKVVTCLEYPMWILGAWSIFWMLADFSLSTAFKIIRLIF